MFMSIETEVDTETVMQKMLESHSINYVLYLAFKTYGYHSPEYLADKITTQLEEIVE